MDLFDPSTSHRTAIKVAKTIRQLVDILAPLQNNNDEQFILVEGLSGIGKTFLLNEMSYVLIVEVASTFCINYLMLYVRSLR